MNNKILVEVYLPSASCSHDVYIPTKLKIYQVNALLSVMMTDLSNGYFTANPDTILCDRESGQILDMNKTVENLKLSNGSKLILI